MICGMYLAAAYLDPDTLPLTRTQLSDALMARFRQLHPRSKALSVQPINSNNFDFVFHLPRYYFAVHLCDPWLTNYWRNIALEKSTGTQPDRERIQLCQTVYHVGGGRPDPDMRYFNDYLFVLEVLESLGKVYLLDRNSLEWV